jgi:pyruvate-formate lyase-activating enzyme
LNTRNYFDARKKKFFIDPNGLSEFANFPKNALVELTNSCNHACIFCKNADQARKSTHLDIDVFSIFIKQAVELGLEELGLYATGEPFMTKGLPDYIKIAKKYGVLRVYITTNGALATLPRVKKCVDAGLNSIKFSINASNREDYALIHGYDDFENVLSNITQIHHWVQTNNVPLQMLGSCVLVPLLKDRKPQHERVFRKYFEDIIYVEAGSQGGQAFDLPFAESVKQAVFGGILSKPRAERPCQLPWSRVHLTAEGYLTACCVDYNLDLVYANIRDANLSDLWNNSKIRSLRTNHLSDSLGGLLCDQCMNNRAAEFVPLTLMQMELKASNLRRSEQLRLEKRFIKIKSLSKCK